MLHLSHQQMQEMLTARPVTNNEELGYSLYHSTFNSIIDETFCKGSTKSIQIREGITYMQVELTFHQDTEVEMMSTLPQVGFGFCLKGHSTAYVKDLYEHLGTDFAMHLSDRTAFIYANKGSGGYQHFWKEKTLQAMYIHFSYESFKELIGASLEELPVELRDALTQHKGSYMYFAGLGQPVLSLCYALLRNPFRGRSREFYIEAKVMELIAYQVDSLLKPLNDKDVIYPPLSREEAEKIDLCYQELQQNLADPPSLLELVKRTGINMYRLKNGFRHRYGETPFQLLTELRMLKAKELLEKRELTVSEVIFEVGYSSLGTFSNAFHKRFGVRPSAFK